MSTEGLAYASGEPIEFMAGDDYQYVRVAQHVFNTPLLVMPDVAETIGAYVRSRMEGVRPEANRFAGRPVIDPNTGAYRGYRREGPVGIISITGELVNRGAWLGASSGLTSYEGILQQVRAAASDGDVETILLDINSPGGEAFGMSDTSRGIREVAGGKKIVAVINSIGASAAYGLATSANEIVVTESGIAGSIGVVMVHFDQSERAAKAGVKATVITNSDGLDKARGHPFAPLTEDDIGFMRAKADKIMDGFVKLVMDHRPILTSEAIRGQRARTFIGEDAVAAGLADRVGTFDAVLRQLTSASQRTTPSRRYSMSTETQTDPKANDEPKGIPQATHDAAVKAARDEGFAAGKAAGLEEGKALGAEAAKAAGMTEATTRIAAILDHENAKGRAQLARHLAFKTSMSPEDAAAAMAVAALDGSTGGSLSSQMKNEPAPGTGAPLSTTKDQPTDARERGKLIALQAMGKKSA